ncbi:DNA-processing protein DprA [Mucilaginibacter myungsuensis]|uniref:DNA-protecting protein DprA n=1 Tax=Mucilaginibacter myungsuensis TaxID=649104 RepID=A0A929PXN6_9SPHI|nr:DNA-processing protein DprA [Mucilaginibacter myungsuensis]MBE9662452.1 DNA-protecting protein DprA [Mucilaginibacter myungsuensis]MDN3597872.1 DNA-processing protein DprA [Mucilaginibacter myungsuensis]
MSLLHQLALTFIKGIGPAYARNLIAYAGDAEAVFRLPPSRLKNVSGIADKRAGMLADLKTPLLRAEEELKFMERNKVEAIYWTDPAFPKRLKTCDDAPLLLFHKGTADLNMHKVISIVGTRKATDYGRMLCEQLIDEMQQYDVLVVSGLALGIDTFAHKESLKNNVPTVGVLGHGFDRMYPAPNRGLADKMLAKGGLLTEYPSGTVPGPENFPARNRIVAGMADATIVVEASIKGGALITAEIANSYNRDVFAFPGRINDEMSEGCNFLIRNNKAGLLSCMADLAFIMGWEKANAGHPKEQLMLPIDLSAAEQQIFAAIRQNMNPIAIDDLAIRINMPTSQLAMNLLNMEMQGFIRSLPGKTYAIN